jgi:hypothetical protein
LTFDDRFNQKIKEGDIPSSVINLTFGDYYDQELNMLPSSIKSLTLYENKKILSNLPFMLEKLIIKKYNKDNYIKLPYGCVFNHSD